MLLEFDRLVQPHLEEPILHSESIEYILDIMTTFFLDNDFIYLYGAIDYLYIIYKKNFLGLDQKSSTEWGKIIIRMQELTESDNVNVKIS